MASTVRSPFRPLAVFMGVMTLAWASNAVEAAPVPAALIALVGLAVVIVAGRARRGVGVSTDAVAAPRSAPVASSPPAVSSVPAVPAAPGRAVGLLVLVEVVGILVTAVLLARTGHGVLVMPAVAVVVAAHFALFLWVQRSWWHLVTSALGVLGAGSALVLTAVGVLDPATGRALAGLSLATCTALYGVVFCTLLPVRALPVVHGAGSWPRRSAGLSAGSCSAQEHAQHRSVLRTGSWRAPRPGGSRRRRKRGGPGC